MDDLTHILSLLDEKTKLYDARFLAQEKAIAVAETQNQKWRENSNEWRAAMDDREVRFATQIELDIQMHAIQDRVAKLELYRAERSGLSNGWVILVSAVGFLLTVVLLYKGFAS